MRLDYSHYEEACKAARARRWLAPGKSRVTHPLYGAVIVPHCSNLAAIENAAEYWHCDLMEIIHDASVWAVAPEDGPVVRPREFCGRKKEEKDDAKESGAV